MAVTEAQEIFAASQFPRVSLGRAGGEDQEGRPVQPQPCSQPCRHRLDTPTSTLHLLDPPDRGQVEIARGQDWPRLPGAIMTSQATSSTTGTYEIGPGRSSTLTPWPPSVDQGRASRCSSQFGHHPRRQPRPDLRLAQNIKATTTSCLRQAALVEPRSRAASHHAVSRSWWASLRKWKGS